MDKHTPSTPSASQSDTLNITSEQSNAAVEMYKGQKANLIMIIGKSGRGKSTAIRTLNPKDVFMINTVGKLLPFQKGLEYSVENNNMIITTLTATICRKLLRISKETDIDIVIIEDAQYIMATEFFDKALIKGYDKFAQMGQNFWSILRLVDKLRPGLKVFLLGHEDESPTERKLKTLGKMIEDKGCPEGLATIVLWAETKIVEGKRVYYFETQSDGITNAKSPMGMFPSQIPNDLQLVSSRVDEYYAGIELKNSKLNFEVV